MTTKSTNNLKVPDVVSILGVNVNFSHDYTSVISLIQNTFMQDGKSHYIVTANPEMIISAQKDTQFMSVLNNADLTVPDGVGLSMAAYYMTLVRKVKEGPFSTVRKFLLGIKVGFLGILYPEILPKRVTGVTLTEELLKVADEKRYSMFFLGGRPRGVSGAAKNIDVDLATEFANKVRSEYPNIVIIGSTSQFTPKDSDDAKTVDYISTCMKRHNVSRLDLLFVAYNFNEQEKFINRIVKSIKVGTSIGVGGTFDYKVGTMTLSPVIIRYIGLEWLYKLLRQPWRYKRIFNAFPTFPLKVFLDSIK